MADHEHPGPNDRDEDASPTGASEAPTYDGALQLPLRLHFSLTAQDASEAEDLAFFQAEGGASKWKAIGCSVTVVAVGLGSLLLRFDPGSRLWVALSVIAMTVFMLWVVRLLNGTGEANVELELDADRLRYATDRSNTIVSAAAFGELAESENLFVLSSGAAQLLIRKDAFPDDRQRDGFRELVATWAESIPKPAVQADEPEAAEHALRVEFELKFSDYVDRALTSWFPRAICLLLLAVFLGVTIPDFFVENPDAVHSDTEVFFFMMGVNVCFMFFVFGLACVTAWNSERTERCETRVTLDDRGLAKSNNIAHSRLDWSPTARFKESRGAFYIWWTGSQDWTTIPKRAFADETDIERCRELLATHAEASTWFWR